jgi:hypothetical protein
LVELHDKNVAQSEKLGVSEEIVVVDTILPSLLGLTAQTLNIKVSQGPRHSTKTTSICRCRFVLESYTNRYLDTARVYIVAVFTLLLPP